jgi:hypothetical protein
MQAIQTHYLPPTNTRCSRIKAFCQAGSIIVSWDHALDADENHRAAMLALVRKLGWPWDCSEIATGVLQNGGYAHVKVPSSK